MSKIYKLNYFFLIILFASCYPNTKEGALKKYKSILESKIWCELHSGEKYSLKNGNFSKIINDSIILLGNYKLDVKPTHGLTGEWFMPIRKFEISTLENTKYLFELELSSGEEILVFKNHKKKEYLYFSDDCILSEIDSVPFKVMKDYNYEQIFIK